MRRLATIVVAALVLTTGISAQQKPNFSGRWVVVSPPKGAGQEQIVTQDEKTLSTQHASEGADHRMVYQLDGVERRQAIPSHGADVTILAAARWDGDRIVITSNARYANGMKTQSREVWSIDPQGRLVIDYTETGPAGPGPTEKIVYVKKP